MEAPDELVQVVEELDRQPYGAGEDAVFDVKEFEQLVALGLPGQRPGGRHSRLLHVRPLSLALRRLAFPFDSVAVSARPQVGRATQFVPCEA